MKRNIYLLRHGNPGQPGDPRRCLGETDVSLSEFGRMQLVKLKNYIESFAWTKVYSSPMRRCIETAECLGIAKESLVIKQDFREMAAGIWENLTFTEIKINYPELYEARGQALGTFSVEGAESFKEAGARFGRCLDEIRQESEENILVIAHAGVIRGYLCMLTGKDADCVMEFPVPYGSITVLEEIDGCLKLKESGLRGTELLDEEEIERIYEKCRTPDNVIRHMEKVAQIAMYLIHEMGQRHLFSEDDTDLIYKAALLHDIRRAEKNHAQKSADFLRKEGYREVAELVALHHSDKTENSAALKLHEVLFYADKRVQDDHIVTIEERFTKSYKKCKGIPEAEAKHRRLYEKTRNIEKKIKKLY